MRGIGRLILVKKVSIVLVFYSIYKTVEWIDDEKKDGRALRLASPYYQTGSFPSKQDKMSPAFLFCTQRSSSKEILYIPTKKMLCSQGA